MPLLPEMRRASGPDRPLLPISDALDASDERLQDKSTALNLRALGDDDGTSEGKPLFGRSSNFQSCRRSVAAPGQNGYVMVRPHCPLRPKTWTVRTHRTVFCEAEDRGAKLFTSLLVNLDHRLKLIERSERALHQPRLLPLPLK